MKQVILITVLVGGLSVGFAQAESSAVNTLLETYASQGVARIDAENGKNLWQKTYQGKGEYASRSCTNCHTDNLTKTGRHIKTNKQIKPMSPVVNPQRLTKLKTIKKWFKRNCKWTMGRKCTPQEKADILTYLTNQSKKF